MSTSYSKDLQTSVRLTLAFLLLILGTGWWIWDVEFQGFSLSQLWASTDGALFFLSLLLISLAMPCVAMRWRALFPSERKKSASPIYLTGILCAAFVFNFALPGPVGEALSAWMAKQRSDISFSEALAGLGLSRIIGLGSACTIAGLVYWIAPFHIPEQWGGALKVATVLLSIAAICLLCIAVFPIVFKERIAQIRTWVLFRPTALQKIFDAADHLFDALSETAGRGTKAYLESIAWSLFGHAMVAIGIFLAIQSMGQTAAWSAVMFTYTASIAGSVAMFMFPGSSVGWDALFATTLSVTANLPVTVATAVTVVIRLQQMIVALIGVLMVWTYAKEFLQQRFSSTDGPPTE